MESTIVHYASASLIAFPIGTVYAALKDSMITSPFTSLLFAFTILLSEALPFAKQQVPTSRIMSPRGENIKGATTTNVLSEEQVRIFERDGVLLVRGLVHGEELKAAMNDVEEVGREESKMFGAAYKNIAFNHCRTSKALKNVAFHSDVPKAAAQLINLKSTNPNRPVRMLKDAVLNFSPGRSGCGWHVDDKGFWPADDSSNGVNVWIALSPMPKSLGGGLAVSPGSHISNFNREARQFIAGGNTCAMESLSPETHQKLEDMKVIYDMQPGDAIIHDRWLFHRSDNFAEGTPKDTVLNRYSIRYMPGEALAYDNHFDPVYLDPKFKGKENMELNQYGGYFPQVFPNIIESEDEL